MIRVDCAVCPLRQHTLFSPFTPEETTFMQGFKTGELSVEPRTSILTAGSKSPQLYTVLRGMGIRYVTLENGRRQVINFVFPGDFMGLQAGLMGEMKHSVESSTEMTLCVFKREDLWHMFRTSPARAYDMTWITAVEEHFLGETIASLGQRDARQRIAWAFVHIHQRLRAVGLGRTGAVPLPYRQHDLADALGLSQVHTNKTLMRLRTDELARWNDGTLTISDLHALAEIAMIPLEKKEIRPLF